MAALPLPPVEVLIRYFRYEPETGKLFYRTRTPDMFPQNSRRPPEASCASWNTCFAETEARKRRGKYLCAMISEKQYYVHRIAWKMATGTEPLLVDHINGDPFDNRISNLRSVTHRGNARNQRIADRCPYGYPGVRLKPPGVRWYARYGDRHLGAFDTREEAVAARQAEEARVGHTTRAA